VDYAPPLAPREDQPPHYKLYIRQFDGDADALREVFRDYSSYIVRANKGACFFSLWLLGLNVFFIFIF